MVNCSLHSYKLYFNIQKIHSNSIQFQDILLRKHSKRLRSSSVSRRTTSFQSLFPRSKYVRSWCGTDLQWLHRQQRYLFEAEHQRNRIIDVGLWANGNSLPLLEKRPGIHGKSVQRRFIFFQKIGTSDFVRDQSVQSCVGRD